MDVNNILEKK